MSAATEKSDVEVTKCNDIQKKNMLRTNETNEVSEKANNDKPSIISREEGKLQNETDHDEAHSKNNEPKCEMKGIKRAAEEKSDESKKQKKEENGDGEEVEEDEGDEEVEGEDEEVEDVDGDEDEDEEDLPEGDEDLDEEDDDDAEDDDEDA